MEFITTEQFLKEDKKVQEVFIDWWKPSMGDLYAWNYSDESENDLHKLQACTSKLVTELTNDNKGINEGDRIPLLTEGQLRKFIEDKTKSYFSCEIINPLVNEEGFRFVFEFYSGKEFKYNEKLRKEIYAIDLLQAYWQVAVQMAKNIDN